MTRGARLAVAWLLLLLLAQCAATPEGPPPPGSLDEDDADDGAEDDEADLPPSPPVIAGEELRSRLPRLSALLPLASGTLPSSMSWLKAGAVTSATTLSRTVLAVRPFLSDPTGASESDRVEPSPSLGCGGVQTRNGGEPTPL